MLKNPHYQYGPANLVIPANIHVGEYALERMWRVKEKVAFINGFTGESTTYETISQQAMNFAISLSLLGIRKGERVAVCSDNRVEFWSVVFGTACAGGTVTTVNPMYTQGKTESNEYEYIKVPTSKNSLLHQSVPHAVAAISRHTKTCVYYTDNAKDDAIARLIKRAEKATATKNRDYNQPQDGFAGGRRGYEIKHVLSISKPKYVVLSPYTYKLYGKFFKTQTNIKTVILLGDQKASDVIMYNDIAISHKGSGNVIVNKRLARNVKFEEFESVAVDGQTDVMFILYSSGTTGLPKGVMLTHLNVLTQCCSEDQSVSDQVVLTITPWFHAMGLIGILRGLTQGRSAVFLYKFEVDTYLKTIEKYRINHLSVVPPIIVAITKASGQYDLSSVEIVYSGAAPLHKDTEDQIKSKFPNVQGVFQGYGMTESTMALTLHRAGAVAKPGSVGYTVPGAILKIVDLETRKPLGPGQTGEICAKGITMMKGYVGKDRREDFDEEGFFKTGDVGYYDEDGSFFIVDRLKELIKYKGFQVAPAEIEALLLKHEAVRDSGVIGIPDKSAGEVPLAFVVTQPGKNVKAEDIQQFVAERLSNPKHLRGGVRFVDAIPKNPSGKIIRKSLRQMAKTKKSKL